MNSWLILKNAMGLTNKGTLFSVAFARKVNEFFDAIGLMNWSNRPSSCSFGEKSCLVNIPSE